MLRRCFSLGLEDKVFLALKMNLPLRPKFSAIFLDRTDLAVSNQILPDRRVVDCK